jgi:hypothetical protein
MMLTPALSKESICLVRLNVEVLAEFFQEADVRFARLPGPRLAVIALINPKERHRGPSRTLRTQREIEQRHDVCRLGDGATGSTRAASVRQKAAIMNAAVVFTPG